MNLRIRTISCSKPCRKERACNFLADFHSLRRKGVDEWCQEMNFDVDTDDDTIVVLNHRRSNRTTHGAATACKNNIRVTIIVRDADVIGLDSRPCRPPDDLRTDVIALEILRVAGGIAANRGVANA